MEPNWLYILLGFFAGMIFCFLLLIGLIKKLVQLTITKKDGNDE